MIRPNWSAQQEDEKAPPGIHQARVTWADERTSSSGQPQILICLKDHSGRLVGFDRLTFGGRGEAYAVQKLVALGYPHGEDVDAAKLVGLTCTVKSYVDEKGYTKLTDYASAEAQAAPEDDGPEPDARDVGAGDEEVPF